MDGPRRVAYILQEFPDRRPGAVDRPEIFFRTGIELRHISPLLRSINANPRARRADAINALVSRNEP